MKIPPHGQCAQSLSSTPVRRTLQVVLTDGVSFPLGWSGASASDRRYGFSREELMKGMTDMPGAESDAAAVTASATRKLASKQREAISSSSVDVEAETRLNSGSVLVRVLIS